MTPKVLATVILAVILSGCNQPSGPPQYSSASLDANSLHRRLRVYVDGKVGFIDGSGKLVINPQWDEAIDFSEGLAVVCIGECDASTANRLNKKYGYIDEDGKMAINPTFEIADDFHEGLAAVCVEGCGAGESSSYLEQNDKRKSGYID